MLAERVAQWEKEWQERSFAAGRQEGLNAERALLYRLTYRRFGEGVAESLKLQLEKIDDTDQLAEMGEWIIDCETGDELIKRVQRLLPTD